MTSSKRQHLVYWVLTLLFLVPQVWSATQYLMEAPRMIAAVQELGYPLYFIKALGVAKLLGAVVIFYGQPRALKEWAYAGFTFDTLGATVSHLSMGQGVAVAAIPATIGVIQLLSYVSWKQLEEGAFRRTEPSEPEPSSVPPSTIPLRGH